MTLKPPVTYDPFVTVQWALENQGDLYAKERKPALNPYAPVVEELKRLVDLPVPRWIYHVKRIHSDPTHLLMSKDDWAQWEAGHVVELPEF